MSAKIDGIQQEPQWVVRFSLSQRLEHWLVMAAFIALMVTGLPQRFHDDVWARFIILHLGGIESVRLIHRFFAFVFVLESVFHVVRAMYTFARQRSWWPSMVPTINDARDSVNALRYFLGFTREKPQFGRYSYRQKYEYWGVIFGGVIMIVTGFVLWYPVFFTSILPGVLIPVMKEIHGWEALLALSIIIIWHLYGTHLSPGNFPLETTIFTGKISVDKLREEHQLEYLRLLGDQEKVLETAPVSAVEGNKVAV